MTRATEIARPLRLLGLAALLACPAVAHGEEPPARGLDRFAVGADLSFLEAAEAGGAVFRDSGVAKPGLAIFRDHGYGWIRLRLFNDPPELPNNLAYTTRVARRAKAMGYRFLLDLHYSDTWADPAKQHIPAAWEGLDHAGLVAAVREYTRDTVRSLQAAGAAPDMVQVGNEVISGMLWPDGKLPRRWPEFAELLRAGVDGVRGARPGDPPLVMVHIDRGGDREGTEFFFDKCLEHGVEFDVIGQSFYPWWHGSLDDLRENLAFMASEYGKDIVLVEVAYRHRPGEYAPGEGPYPESPDGQRRFLEDVAAAVRATPGGRGKGVFWWEPAVARGPIWARGMFGDNGEALPVIGVFDGAPAAASASRDAAERR